jgi:hypothetical protein
VGQQREWELTDQLAVEYAHPVLSLEDAIVGVVLKLHHDLSRWLEEIDARRRENSKNLTCVRAREEGS